MGLLDILNGMQNGPRGATQPGKGGMSPLTMGLLALLAYKAYQTISAGSPQQQQGTPPMPGASGGDGLGSLLQGGLGGLGGLLAGAAGGAMMKGGLNDLLKKLEQNGLGDTADSWVGPGGNRSISPDDLHRVLGNDAIDALAQQSGMSANEVLSTLSQQLPGAIDHITPQGRVPTENEMSRML